MARRLVLLVFALAVVAPFAWSQPFGFDSAARAGGSASSQPFTITGATSAGGSGADSGESIALSSDFGTYVAGTFEGTASFGNLVITSAGESDFFLAAYSDTFPLWVRRGGTDVFNDFGTAVAVAPDGSVYAAGYFTGIATWDGGDNPDGVLTTFSDFDAFIAKYTPTGDLEWVRQAGGAGQDTARDLAVDANGNVYLVGGFEGTGMFGSTVLESAGSTDAFLVKYDPEGEVVWARRAGSDQGDLAYGVAVTDDGRAHVSGSFRGVALFGSLPVQSAGSSDVFVAQYDAAGEPVWVEGIGADGSEFTRGGGIGLGSDESVYVQGSFSNTILVGKDVLASTGFTDIFIAKLTADGDEVWGRRGGGDGTNFSAALAVVDYGSGADLVLLTGYIDGTGTFDSWPLTTQGRDGYVAVFSPFGQLIRIELIGGVGQDAGAGIAAEPPPVSGDVYIGFTGSFRETILVEGFPDTELESAGGSDAYVVFGVFIGGLATEPETQPRTRLATASPNPFRERTALALNVAEAQDVTVGVFDLLGRRVSVVHEGLLTIGAHRMVIEAVGLPAGVYVVRAEGETFRQSQRLTVVR